MKDLRGFGCPTCGSITLEFRGQAPRACPKCRTRCPGDKNWMLMTIYRFESADKRGLGLLDSNQKSLPYEGQAEKPPIPTPGVSVGGPNIIASATPWDQMA